MQDARVTTKLFTEVMTLSKPVIVNDDLSNGRMMFMSIISYQKIISMYLKFQMYKTERLSNQSYKDSNLRLSSLELFSIFTH